MMKNNRRFILLVTMVMLLCTITLTGCQLAIPTTNTYDTSDQFCGVFVTIGYHNLAMNDNALNDMDVTINNQGEVSFNEFGNTSLRRSRIDGKITEDKDTVIFDGISGYYMGVLQEQDENGEYYTSLMCDSSLSDVKYSINASDNSDERNGEATLYVSRDFHEIIYLNPVYLTSDGSFYTILGSAMGASLSGEVGMIGSQTIESELEKKRDDSSKTERSSYKINVAVVEAVMKTVIKEMNQNDELVKVTQYLPNSPEEFTVDSETAYVIVEEVLDSSSTVKGVKRSVYNPLPKDSFETSNQHRCFYSGENSIIDQELIKFIRE